MRHGDMKTFTGMDESDRAETSQLRQFIRAQSNSLGRDAAREVPELENVLRADGLAALDYDDTQRHDGRAQRLRTLLGNHEGMPSDRIVLGCSGLDWIPTLAASLGIKTLVRIEGDFPGFERYSLLQGVRVVTIPVDPLTRTLDPAVVAEKVRGLEAAMLCSTFPFTNPLQTPISEHHLAAAMSANSTLIFLVDGAYSQFSDHRRLAKLADHYDRVIYLQVASKHLFLPGARLSWLISSERYAARIAETALPYPLNTVAIGQAISLLENPSTLRALRMTQTEARDFLTQGLGALGLPLITGAGPWVLFKWPTNASSLVSELETRFRILVQQQVKAPLDHTWVRVSATTEREALLIIEAVRLMAGEGFANLTTH